MKITTSKYPSVHSCSNMHVFVLINLAGFTVYYYCINIPLLARLSLAPAASRVGLRSEMGLALHMFPPRLCVHNRR